MKKLILTLAAAVLLATSAFAEGFIVKGGLTYGNVASKDIVKSLTSLDIKSYTGWHAGIGYQTGTLAGFSLQPELLYNLKGANSNAGALKLNYLELPVNVQWGIDLIIARPFLMVSPYIGYCMSGKWDNEKLEDMKDRLEYGFGLGAGINIWKIQVTAKYSWNFGQVSSLGEYWSKITDNNKTNGGLEISAAICF